MNLSGTLPANHHCLPAADDCADQPRNRVFERHRIFSALRTRRMVDALTRWPSLSSSPWILLYPQLLFSVASRSISAAISVLTGAVAPPLPGAAPAARRLSMRPHVPAAPSSRSGGRRSGTAFVWSRAVHPASRAAITAGILAGQ